MNYSVNLNITPGGMPPILHMSQYDTGRTYLVTITGKNGSPAGLGTNPTAKVKGFNGKNCFEIDATVANSVVTFTLTEASTDQCGVFPVTIELTVDGQDIISPLCMIFDVQKAGYTNEQAASSPEFENAMEEAAQKYVLGMDESARIALLDLLAYAAYTGPDAQAKFDTLETALQAKLAYIVADYVQDRTVYDTDSLDKIKEGDDLIVTAYYDDGSYSDLEDSQYTLSGTLTAGTSTITVTYGGKTATFNVTVTAYWDFKWDYTQGKLEAQTNWQSSGEGSSSLTSDAERLTAAANKTLAITQVTDSPYRLMTNGYGTMEVVFVGNINQSGTFRNFRIVAADSSTSRVAVCPSLNKFRLYDNDNMASCTVLADYSNGVEYTVKIKMLGTNSDIYINGSKVATVSNSSTLYGISNYISSDGLGTTSYYIDLKSLKIHIGAD